MLKFKISYEKDGGHKGIEGESKALLAFMIQDGEQGMFSIDGETLKAMDPHDIWKAWIILAKHLSEMDGLSPGYKTLSNNTWEIFNKFLNTTNGHLHAR